MRNTNGFTLIELMVTLTVAAIILTVGVPSFRSVIQNNRAATQANELVGALHLARAEAVKRGLPVAVCASTDGSSCSGSADWATGWIVFEDPEGGTKGAVDAGEPLLRVHAALEANSSLTSGGSSFVRYDRLGYQDAGASVFDLEPADCSGTMKRQISLSPSGGPSTEKVSC